MTAGSSTSISGTGPSSASSVSRVLPLAPWRTTSSARARLYGERTTSPSSRSSSASPSVSEVAAEGLLTLDRLEQRLEVAVAEAARAVALDDLEEDRRPVADRLREDLQQVALVVAVDEDAEPLEVLDV